MPAADFRPYFVVHPSVRAALEEGRPVVALESTVITHGLPRPTNLEAAHRLEAIVQQAGATPATVGIVGGTLIVGLSDDQIERLAMSDEVYKVSRRDLPIVAAHGLDGSTTVAATMLLAHWAGVRVFATGGIGGVHRGGAGDVSADLPELARTPVAVVCSGAKSVLDLPRTLEWLETHGVPVIGYQTDTLPAFYALSSGLPVDVRVESPQEAADIVRTGWEIGLETSVLIAVPPPASLALPGDEMEQAIETALAEAGAGGVSGKALTPFLLSRLAELTGGRSLAVNLALLERNARVGSGVAVALSESSRTLE
jgi:pseudouridine-5'-phosphate glycosidase